MATLEKKWLNWTQVSKVVTFLVKKLGAKLYGVSSIPSNPSMYEVINHNLFEKEFNLDITFKDKVLDIFGIEPDYVFHQQPLVSVSYENPSNTIMTNSIGTMNILEGLKTIKKVTAILLPAIKFIIIVNGFGV